MSAEAVGYALREFLGWDPRVIPPTEMPWDTGERFLRHLSTRGYKVVYDPSIMTDLPPVTNAPPTRLDIELRRQVPDEEKRIRRSVTLEMGGMDIRCEACGCYLFDVLGEKATCSNCQATYRMKGADIER